MAVSSPYSGMNRGGARGNRANTASASTKLMSQMFLYLRYLGRSLLYITTAVSMRTGTKVMM
jgi:hypothetical protein